MSKLYVVTGGAGFIGSHLVDKFLNEGHRVIVLDDFSTGSRANLVHHKSNRNLEVYEVNIVTRLWSTLSSVLGDRQVDSIVHLAAQTAVIQSIADPIQDVRVNYSTTIEVLEFARLNKIKNILFASSAAVYGDSNIIPIDETAACSPMSPYGINKLGSEYYLNYYKEVHGLNTTAFRFFNVFGPRQDPDNSYSGVISIFFNRALQNKDIIIFGDGEQTRDFVFVDDVVTNIAYFTKNSIKTQGPINVGTSSKTSITDLAKMIIKITGSNSKIIFKSPRAGEIRNSQSCIKKAKSLNPNFPTFSVEEGLKLTSEWFRQSEC